MNQQREVLSLSLFVCPSPSPSAFQINKFKNKQIENLLLGATRTWQSQDCSMYQKSSFIKMICSWQWGLVLTMPCFLNLLH